MKHLQKLFGILLFSALNLACGIDLDFIAPDGNGFVSMRDETMRPQWLWGDADIAKGATLHLAVSEPNISRTQIELTIRRFYRLRR